MRYTEFTEGTWDSAGSINDPVARSTAPIRGPKTLADIPRDSDTKTTMVPGVTNTGVTNGNNTDPDLPGGGPTQISRTRALFTMNGQQSRLTKPNAGNVMQSDTLPRFRRMQQAFGASITINDAIAKAGSSRERNTPNSQHFAGTALDLSTSGMNDAQKILLVRAAQSAGFTGFGFGNSILHVDTGPRRHWAYGNSTFGGVSVAQLGSAVRSGQPISTA